MGTWEFIYYLTGCRSNSHLVIILSHTVVDIQFPALKICSYRSPDGPSLVIYGNVLPFITNSTLLTIVNKNIYNKLYIQRKSHNVCYIQSCYIADTCTEQQISDSLAVTHARLPGVSIFSIYYIQLIFLNFN